MDLSSQDWAEIVSSTVAKKSELKFTPLFPSPYLKVFCSAQDAKDTWHLAGWMTLYIGNISFSNPTKYQSKKILLKEWSLLSFDAAVVSGSSQIFYLFRPPSWMTEVNIIVQQYQPII